MVICRYYQAGRCRYGNNCRFEHVDPPGGFGNGKDPFSTPTKPNNRFGGNRTDEQPQWPLSAIGKDDAEQGNEVAGDWSPEELRVLAYSMAPRGMSADVTQRERQLVSEHQAKVGNMSQDGMQSFGHGGGNDSFQAKDPFSQSVNAAGQPGSGFGGGFGSGGMNGGGQQQGFGQQQQQQPQNSNPFGAVPQGGNPFSQSQPFSQSAPPQDVQVQNTAPPASGSTDPQFSAAQFGFAKIPEAAPPPQYY